MATLEHFLRTGELGPIRTGMTEAQIVSMLGEPEARAGRRRSESITVYGGLQLAFRPREGGSEYEVVDIALPFVDALVENTPKCIWPLDDFPGLSAETMWDQFRSFLKNVGLWNDDDVEIQDREDGMRDLFVPPGGYLTFHNEKLFSIHFVEAATPQKQISLTVSQDTLDRLKHLARLSKKSVSAFCADWITKRANESQDVPEQVASR